MALPLAAIALGAQVTGGILNAFSQASAYSEQKATTKYNKAILDANNLIDQSLTDMDIRRIRDEGEELLGAQRAYIGKSGTKFSGSNIDVFMDTVKDIEMDIITMEIGKSVGSYKTQQQKQLLDMDLRSAKKALPYKIGSSLLGSASGILSSRSNSIAQKTAGSGYTSSISNTRKMDLFNS